MTEPRQGVVWDPPARDQTPIEKGGAVLIVRLTPAETAYLLTLAPTLHEAVHRVLATVENPSDND